MDGSAARHPLHRVPLLRKVGALTPGEAVRQQGNPYRIDGYAVFAAEGSVVRDVVHRPCWAGEDRMTTCGLNTAAKPRPMKRLISSTGLRVRITCRRCLTILILGSCRRSVG